MIDSKQEKIVKYVMPFLSELCKGNTQGEILRDFENKTGSDDYITLLNISNTYEQLMRCMKNYEELMSNISFENL